MAPIYGFAVCAALTVFLARPTVGAAEDLAPRDSAAERCERGAASDCEVAAMAYHRGEGVKKDESKAATLYQRGCELGSAKACGALGVQYMFGSGVTKDLRRALGLLEQACQASVATGCTNAGAIYAKGGAGDKDLAKAVALFQKSCDLEPKTCFNLAGAYLRGEGVPRDAERATLLYETACNAGHAWSCNNLAGRYATGDGASKDILKAAALYEKACFAEDSTACMNLLSVATENPTVVVPLLDQGCAKGDPDACVFLALMYSEARGVQRDVDRAKSLLQKACGGGGAAGCAQVERACKEGFEIACGTKR